MKENYQKELDKLINNMKEPKKLLLHSCCAPCSSYVISYLSDYFEITVLYYNPNIEPIEEYNYRKEEQIKLINTLKTKYKVSFMDCDYDNDLYHDFIKGLEEEKEGGKRCSKCFLLRLEKTAELAKKNKFDYFGTTLTVSPYKNAFTLNSIGKSLEIKYNVKYLISDFKKKEGYKKSIELSKKYNLYRQNYCGCIYSKRRDLYE